jgi:hypothetical protein
MKEPPRPPPDEYDAFRRLAERLIAVPKKELDEQRAADKANKGNGEGRQPKRRRPS